MILTNVKMALSSIRTAKIRSFLTNARRDYWSNERRYDGIYWRRSQEPGHWPN